MVIKLLAFHTQIVDFIGRKWGKYFVGNSWCAMVLLLLVLFLEDNA
jgi:hypothetical protein